MACPWFNKYREHLSDGACFLYPNEENANTQIHVHDDTQYSTDPLCGQPFAQTYAKELDPCRIYKFSLNRRVCSVATEIEPNDVHLVAYTPTNAIELWTMVRLVINKWTEFNTRTGYWPSVCTVIDTVVNTDRLSESREPWTEPDIAAVRSIRPVHFVKDCSSLVAAVDRLIYVLFDNYYSYVLDTSRDGSFNDDFTTAANGGRVKARRIECDIKDYAGGFWERHDVQKYKDFFSRSDNTEEWASLQCRLKQILDGRLLERLQNNNRRRQHSNAEGDTDYLLNNDTTLGLIDSPAALINAERTRAKSLFHAIVVDTFGNHRDYPHTIMCREFIVKDKRYCSLWLNVVHKFSEYRLCRLKQECDEDEEERARTGIRQIMKEWNSLFPNLTESARQRKKELIKIMRKQKKNDVTIAASFAGQEIQ